MDNTNTIIDDIDKINFVVSDIGEKINILNGAIVTGLSINEYVRGVEKKSGFYLKTNRQIAKKLISLGGNMYGFSASNVINNNENDAIRLTMNLNNISTGEMNNEEMAHFIVYGKFLYDDKGNLIDNEIEHPECVGQYPGSDTRIKIMSDDFPILQEVKKMKMDMINSVAALRIKAGEIIIVSKEIPPQLILAITTIASAAVVLFPGSGLPTAISAIRNLLSSITALLTRISQLLTILGPLNYLELLLENSGGFIDSVHNIMDMLYKPLVAIQVILGTIVAPVMALIPKIPGVDSPAEPIEVDLKASSTQILRGEEVTIETSASKGTWQYTYSWSSVPSGFNSSEKIIKVKPFYTTKYFVKVSDKNGNGSNMSSILIKVL